MKLLADENLPRVIVDWLRGCGHDVWWAAESQPGADDTELLARAVAESRIVITQDLGFGELVFRRGLAAHAIVQLRIRSDDPNVCLQRFTNAWDRIQDRVSGAFTVIADFNVRVIPLPDRES